MKNSEQLNEKEPVYSNTEQNTNDVLFIVQWYNEMHWRNRGCDRMV